MFSFLPCFLTFCSTHSYTYEIFATCSCTFFITVVDARYICMHDDIMSGVKEAHEFLERIMVVRIMGITKVSIIHMKTPLDNILYAYKK